MTSLPKGAEELANHQPSDANSSSSKSSSSLFSNIFTSPFSIFESSNPNNLFSSENKNNSKEQRTTKPRTNDWSRTLKRIITGGGAMWRFQERILGMGGRIDTLSQSSDIWLLGVCYKVAAVEESSSGGGGGTGDDDADNSNGFPTFLEDYSSRIWITYRRGFEAMGEARYTSDVNWGCMIRSSQMLVAQALIFHHLGRSWRKPTEKPYNQDYIKVLHQFGDSESCSFSIHNLLQAGKEYGLAAGSWVGPYAMCRAWETLAKENSKELKPESGKESLPFAVYVVSGDGDGERGGAPVLYRDVASRLSSEFSEGSDPGAPILLLVPLVLGLDKVNPRYMPLLKETFMFPQSLGILGGKPGASTYIVGVQDEKALYFDPHEVQQAVGIASDNLEADTSSYHCSSTVRHMPLDQIDPSLAIGFYCRDKGDFDDLCSRSSELGEKANGAPLFTVSDSLCASSSNKFDDTLHSEHLCEYTGEDEWQLL